MKTILTTSPAEAAEFIKRGGIVAFPTETVYGLGANVFDEKAIKKIFQAKQRPNDNPLIAHVGNIEQIKLLVSKINETAQKFTEAFFPAPLTLVLQKAKNVPLIATANLETIGVRMPKNELALEFLKNCETPIVAPSANISGKPSPTTWQAVFEDLNQRIDCILQGEATEVGLESTVLDCTTETPFVLRTGAVTLEQLQKIEPKTRLYKISEMETPKSPGLKHRHYSPQAKVILVSSKFNFQCSKSQAFIGLKKPDSDFEMIKICQSVEEYAHSIFDFFRRCDHENIETIYCEKVAEKGIGLALMDRLKRAAAS
ncbi:MAG: threonylcarbamoyl-AMP synthase [Acidobacteria bacterium]|nr:threonylcarbamoyl-AMP synthase [Acidobacteriota bacterium]MCA1637649.1 threonylcarbamoyl-AMP synthase [Acidobacteriota bacterium]